MVSTAGRRLIVMRHATAEPFAAQDEQRQLTQAGLDAASAAGTWLAGHSLVPDFGWVSAATRTRQTWNSVCSAMGSQPLVRVEQALYSAGPENVIDLLSQTPDDAETVLLIGHNPTAAYLVHLLDSGQPDATAWRRVSEAFPPASMAVLDYEGEWAQLAIGSAHLRDFHVGGRDS